MALEGLSGLPRLDEPLFAGQARALHATGEDLALCLIKSLTKSMRSERWESFCSRMPLQDQLSVTGGATHRCRGPL